MSMCVVLQALLSLFFQMCRLTKGSEHLQKASAHAVTQKHEMLTRLTLISVVCNDRAVLKGEQPLDSITPPEPSMNPETHRLGLNEGGECATPCLYF